MSADSPASTQKHLIHPNSLANLRPVPWKPGQSGNPGGNYRHTPKVSNAYARLLAMSPEQIESFVPSNGAEEIALARYKQAKTKRGLKDAIEVTDRTEGKAAATIRIESDESERLIIRLQERFLARTGIELSRSDAIARLTDLDPSFAGQLTE